MKLLQICFVVADWIDHANHQTRISYLSYPIKQTTAEIFSVKQFTSENKTTPDNSVNEQLNI
jgi:hypothetical protein